MIQPNESTPSPNDPSGAKLQLAMSMQSFGIRMMRQNLLRRHPDESADQIDQRLIEWLAKTPDADDPRFEVRKCKTFSKNT